jgi:aminoglycoside phosphotransferase (APT) family kinase protein
VAGSGRTWSPVERLDADRVARALQDSTGVALVVEGSCPGGQVGAAYVRWPDGHRSVLTWQPDRTMAQLTAGPLAVVETLHAAGYPAPRIELAVELDDAVALIQELLPGSMIERLGPELLDQALALNDRQTDALAERPDVDPVHLHLVDDGPGFCLHEPLRRHGRRSARLERWIREVGAEHPPQLSGTDAVHVDFQPTNLLADGDRITGVVDWDGAGRGDRRLDLVTLRFGLLPLAVAPRVVDRLDEILDAIPPQVLRPAWAHMSLRMTDWAIRHFTPSTVERWMDLAETRAS